MEPGLSVRIYSANIPYDKSIRILISSDIITQRFHTYTIQYAHRVTNNSAVEYKTVCLFCIHVASMAYIRMFSVQNGAILLYLHVPFTYK